jgi:hypothetical protein
LPWLQSVFLHICSPQQLWFHLSFIEPHVNYFCSCPWGQKTPASKVFCDTEFIEDNAVCQQIFACKRAASFLGHLVYPVYLLYHTNIPTKARSAFLNFTYLLFIDWFIYIIFARISDHMWRAWKWNVAFRIKETTRIWSNTHYVLKTTAGIYKIGLI